MIFPTPSIQNYAMKENAIKEDLAAFTLCFFVKLDPNTTGYQNVYSYAAESSLWANGLYLALFSPTIAIAVEDKER